MCGLVGLIDYSKNSTEKLVLRMQQTLNHRGPDGQGSLYFQEEEYIIGLAHKRLSILDLSASGSQPMAYKEFVILLNGEIYNFIEIREDLRKCGHKFISTSDTEVVIHAYQEWGKKCVEKFIGMFSFIIYDQKKKQILACRDRVGVKPFYYYWANGLFLFASELKAFHQHPGFQRRLNQEMVFYYLKVGYVPSPHSIFENVFKLEAGTWLTFNLEDRVIALERYWTIENCFDKPKLKISYSDAVIELEKFIQTACDYRMIADVPVGVFLSGGFDSTLVTALLQKSRNKKIKTFTIGFPDGINEAPFAKKIASHLGTEHTSYDCELKDAENIIPDLPYFFDELCGDISAIPTILVSRLARKDVTVSLSADGGDELFAGYNGFSEFQYQIQKIRKLPAPKISAFLLNQLSATLPNDSFSLRRKMSAVANVLKTNRAFQFEELLNEANGLPSDIVNYVLNSDTGKKIKNSTYNAPQDERDVLFIHSFNGALVDLLLPKVDRSTMSASLEGREPLLDHNLIEFAARLPFEFKHDGVISKKILKDIVYKHVPKPIMDRPKIGFDLPIFKWLRGDLNYLIKEFLSEEKIKMVGVFCPIAVKNILNKFEKNLLMYNDIIWRLLQFQMWYLRWIN